jgi:outer membrane protein OmpA-like peptidoglycan-associated protein
MPFGRLILAASWLAAAPASAQVTTNNGALDALGKPEAPAHRPAPHRAPPHPAPPKPVAEQPAPTPPPKIPTVPLTPPAILALPPPVVVPLAHPPPMPTIPLADDAPGQAIPIKGGVRITFGPDRADLNPASVAVLRDFAHGLLDQTLTSINIYAYAAGVPEDPSTPRRLSLERALAARAVLMNEGIPSPRIYARALGPLGGGAMPDRIDVVAGAPTPASASPAAPGRAG